MDNASFAHIRKNDSFSYVRKMRISHVRIFASHEIVHACRSG